jgi:hypothetical protein
VLRRLSGQTTQAPPVLSFITQFGGGKIHTLTALYHLANSGPAASAYPGIANLLSSAGLQANPAARVGVFVGNARGGRETLARQIVGDAGVAALGASARTTAPGTPIAPSARSGGLLHCKMHINCYFVP